jgi:hypothetical protein
MESSKYMLADNAMIFFDYTGSCRLVIVELENGQYSISYDTTHLECPYNTLDTVLMHCFDLGDLTIWTIMEAINSNNPPLYITLNADLN